MKIIVELISHGKKSVEILTSSEGEPTSGNEHRSALIILDGIKAALDVIRQEAVSTTDLTMGWTVPPEGN